MNVTIDDAIHAMALLRDEVNENGFLHECYNLSISALQTVKDGNYIIEDEAMKAMIEKIAEFDCIGRYLECDKCPLHREGVNDNSCISMICEKLRLRKETELWVHEHWNELKTL